MCKDVRFLGIESIGRYFFGIVGILGCYDFIIFPSRRNTLIFQSCTMFSK